MIAPANRDLRSYRNMVTASVNLKGVLDIDSFKGCPMGIAAHGKDGCYGLCYAAKISRINGLDFASGSERLVSKNKYQMNLFGFEIGQSSIFRMVRNHKLSWFRIGTMGDPSHSWSSTLDICRWLYTERRPIIVTKHWIECPGYILEEMSSMGVIFNTSISALDSKEEIEHRLSQNARVSSFGIKSVLRVVTCKFGMTESGERLFKEQRRLISIGPYIDNPLRIPESDSRVVCGDIVVEKVKDLNSVVPISLHDRGVYVGRCEECPDQCGLNTKEG